MPSAPQADSTRDRIVEAATAEFARYGISGARIDRIARSAKTSKERVYAYFRSKERLYQYVAARELEAVAEATQLDPSDLPGYAGRVHDYFVANPHARRIMRWGALEFTDPDGASRDTAERKTATLHQAQQEGLLDASWHPLDVLVFVNQLASAWVDQPGLPPVDSPARAQFMTERRAAIVAAVQRLFPSAGTSAP